MKLPGAPPSLEVGCSAPVDLPDRGLTQAETETLWGRDRGELLKCGGQVEVLIARYRALSEALDGQGGE